MRAARLRISRQRTRLAACKATPPTQCHPSHTCEHVPHTSPHPLRHAPRDALPHARLAHALRAEGHRPPGEGHLHRSAAAAGPPPRATASSSPPQRTAATATRASSQPVYSSSSSSALSSRSRFNSAALICCDSLGERSRARVSATIALFVCPNFLYTLPSTK